MALKKAAQFICRAGKFRKAARVLWESCRYREGVSIALLQLIPAGPDNPSSTLTQPDGGWEPPAKSGMSHPHFRDHFGLQGG